MEESSGMKVVYIYLTDEQFEKNVFMNVACPYCGKVNQVLVSIYTVETCETCAHQFIAEFLTKES